MRPLFPRDVSARPVSLRIPHSFCGMKQSPPLNLGLFRQRIARFFPGMCPPVLGCAFVPSSLNKKSDKLICDGGG